MQETVSVTGAVITGVGNTAAWSNSGIYLLPVGTARTTATLTLTIATDGTYTWSFTTTTL